MADLVEVKEVVAGPKWSAVTFGEALLSRTVLCRAGACFLAMMPFTKLAALAAAADGPDKALTMTRIADELGSMSLDALEHHGGAYILLRPGEGAMLPAGWIYMQCGLGYMQATRAFYKEHQLAYDCGMSFFVARQVQRAVSRSAAVCLGKCVCVYMCVCVGGGGLPFLVWCPCVCLSFCLFANLGIHVISKANIDTGKFEAHSEGV